MKTALKFILANLLIGCLCACGPKGSVSDGIIQGIYETSQQAGEMQDPEAGPVPAPGEEPLTYDQYQKEREDMLKEAEESGYEK